MDDTPVEDSFVAQDEVLEDELHGYEVNEVHRLYFIRSTSYRKQIWQAFTDELGGINYTIRLPLQQNFKCLMVS